MGSLRAEPCAEGAGARGAAEEPAEWPGLWPEGGAIGIMVAVGAWV